MQQERRRGGVRYVAVGHGQDRRAMELLAAQWPGSLEPRWEAMGIMVHTPAGAKRTPACWVVWAPAGSTPAEPVELDDPATFAPPAPAPAPAPAAPRPARPRARPKHKNVTRIESGAKTRPGYLVRLQWGKQRRAKFFADAAHGDRLGALTAALEWRDQAERELGKPRTSLRNVVGVGTSNTGVVGVSRTMHGGHAVFQVTWSEDGRQRRRVFNIAKLGEKRALAAAKKLREQAERRRLR